MKYIIKIQRLFKGVTSLYILGEVVLKGLNILAIPLITYLLSVNEYAKYSLYLSYLNIFQILLSLNFNSSIVRVYAESRININDYISSNYFIIFLFQLLLLFLLIINIDVIIRITKFSYSELILIYISSVIFFIYNTILNIYQAKEDSKNFVKVNLFRNISILLVSLFLFIILVDNKYVGKIYSDIIIGLIIIILFIANKKINMSKLNFKYIQYFFTFSIPLIPHALSGIVLSQADRIIISTILTEYETGLYSFGYNIGMILNIFIVAIMRSYGPKGLKILYRKRESDLINLVKKYFGFILIIALNITFFAPIAIKLFIKKEYYDSIDIIPIVVTSYIFVFIYSTYVLYSFHEKKTFIISILTIIAAILNIVLNILFIPKYGYKIAAVTTLFCYFILMVLHYLNARYYLGKDVIPIKFYFVYIIMFSCYLIFHYFSLFYSSIIYFLIEIFLFILFNVIVIKKLIIRKG